MPIVTITMTQGRTAEQKRRMFTEVTEALHQSLGAPKSAVRSMINEIPKAHFAIAGESLDGAKGSDRSERPDGET
jgi:4-oxalocrotonate tautomerase